MTRQVRGGRTEINVLYQMKGMATWGQVDTSINVLYQMESTATWGGGLILK